MTRKPPAAKRVSARQTPNEHERATEGQETKPPERAVLNETTNMEERAVTSPKTKPAKRANSSESPTSAEPPSFEQNQKALRRYVENFYDIQEMRLAAGGRTAKKPRKDKNGQPIPEIKLHEWDKERLEHTKDKLQEAEDSALKDIEFCLQRVPFYVSVLSDKKHFRGIGPTMAGVILSSFDIHRSDTVSKMWALAGLRPMPCFRCKSCQSVVTDNEDGTFIHPKIDKIACTTKPRDTRELTRADVFESANAQRAQAGVKLNFNKWLRTKLVGVLGPVILKMTTFHCPKCMDKMSNLKAEGKATEFYMHPARKESDPRKACEWAPSKVEKGALIRMDAPFRKFYDDYKNRKTQAGWGVSDGHRHNAAVRYMVKMILLDIHTKWRRFEGLPVRPTYQEQYLGHTHHTSQENQTTDVSQPSGDTHTMPADQSTEVNQIEEAMLEEEILRAQA